MISTNNRATYRRKAVEVQRSVYKNRWTSLVFLESSLMKRLIDYHVLHSDVSSKIQLTVSSGTLLCPFQQNGGIDIMMKLSLRWCVEFLDILEFFLYKFPTNFGRSTFNEVQLDKTILIGLMDGTDGCHCRDRVSIPGYFKYFGRPIY